MKLWLGILIGLLIGFSIGVVITKNIWEPIIEEMQDTFDFCSDELKKCYNRSSTNIDVCEEILAEKNIFIKEMIDTSFEDCSELINDYKESCDNLLYEDRERGFEYCDERVERWKQFYEGLLYEITQGTDLPICSYNAYNCDNFQTWSEAQTVMEYCESQGKGDVHYLDGDDDGIACENLYYDYGESNLNFGLL